jgi:ankyrin repeat protein
MLACAEGHAGCAKFLAESGADPFVADKVRGQTCLHYAALANSEDTIKELLKTIEGPQSQGATAR